MFQTYIQNTDSHASYNNMYFVYSYINYPFIMRPNKNEALIGGGKKEGKQW